VRLTLYAIPASHPCDCVVAALELKGLAYKRIDMVPGLHRLQARLAYGARTAPGLKLDGERIAGSRRILRRLEELAPEPALLPADPAARQGVEEVERWGDEVLQPLARRLSWAVLRRRPAAMESYATGANLPVPISLTRPTLPLVARLSAHANGADDAAARADLEALPGHLERVDGWIAQGVLGGERPNAADLQVGSSIRLLASLGDIRPLVEGHASAALTRYFQPLKGHVEAGILPADWVPAAG
jgi:glutathione S-transferase